MKHGKKYVEAAKLYDKFTQYEKSEAVAIVKKLATAKFDETIDIAVNLGVDPKYADQMVRGVCSRIEQTHYPSIYKKTAQASTKCFL